ncbi:MAG: hypothetical protein L3J14_04875 [Flavobacteriaceae bacterium]|nr:hypothetical protein [Flavobacteriaceae bacterium]
MENLITIKNEYNSLDKLHEFLKKDSNYEYSKEYDIWEHRTDANGQMEQCIVVKKSSMHAIKVFFVNDNTVKINYIIPNKMMHAYFGKSVKARRNILEVITGTIKQAVLASSQKKAFEEMEKVFNKISA